jgi:hypothetical protein
MLKDLCVGQDKCKAFMSTYKKEKFANKTRSSPCVNALMHKILAKKFSMLCLEFLHEGRAGGELFCLDFLFTFSSRQMLCIHEHLKKNKMPRIKSKMKKRLNFIL